VLVSATEHLGGQFEEKDYEGRYGDPSHMTRKQSGMLPISAVADMHGLRGEVPGEHRNRQGEKWESFKDDVRTNGIRDPIHINVDVGKPVRIYEGSHRRDVAVELGHSHIPAVVQYFGRAELHTDVFRDRR
jgi:hypothetical protein